MIMNTVFREGVCIYENRNRIRHSFDAFCEGNDELDETG